MTFSNFRFAVSHAESQIRPRFSGNFWIIGILTSFLAGRLQEILFFVPPWFPLFVYRSTSISFPAEIFLLRSHAPALRFLFLSQSFISTSLNLAFSSSLPDLWTKSPPKAEILCRRICHRSCSPVTCRGRATANRSTFCLRLLVPLQVVFYRIFLPWVGLPEDSPYGALCFRLEV